MTQLSENFTEQEKATFLEIVKAIGEIAALDNKRYDTASIDKKNKMWDNLAMTFNAQITHPRSTKQLVVLWRDLKAKAKKDYAAQKSLRI